MELINKPLLSIAFRGIKEKDLIIKKVFKKEDYDLYQIVLHRFENKARKPYLLSELNLDDNTLYFIGELRKDSNIKEDNIKLLLNDFSKVLKTRSRESEKNVIFIMSDRFVLLAHSKGGKGITKFKKDVNVRDRVLDTDNFNRYILFDFFKETEPKIYFYEDIKTDAFANYLGIPDGERYYNHGQISLYTELHGRETAFLYSEDELYLEFKKNPHLLKDSKINLENGQFYPLTNLRWGSRLFGNSEKFKEEFFNKMENLNGYVDDYDTIRKQLFYHLREYIDKKEGVLLTKENKVVIPKRHKNYYLIFADKYIHLDNAFSTILINRMQNEDHTKLFHVGNNYSSSPAIFFNIEIYNDLFSEENEMYFHILDIMNKIYSDIQGQKMKNLFVFLALNFLSEFCSAPFSEFIKQLKNDFGLVLNLKDEKLQNNQEEISNFDYKSEKDIDASPVKAKDRIKNDITIKLEKINSIFLIYGIADDKTIEGIPKNRLASDKITLIENNLREELNTLLLIKIYKISISEDRCLICVTAFK